MSKNVAVFVDVANIFYAAKAAGIDIDYVTLLKSATANRDFVRAYAYTGLDPENENQRQFHAFLARSGYKVVSKDIRKYGDGRVKANLDIELVVDMMRMAEKLDVAVVVSGDGDFAPAIAAVQQMGTRVEVISFRGNTSSDLIDVADVFIDITNVAKVEKGARSGRRVASDGDLSMTEVPDKESGVTPRRRRRRDDDGAERTPRTVRAPRRRGGRPAEADQVEKAESVESPPAAAGLVALPGEKLSRGAEVAEVPEEAVAAVAAEAADEQVAEDGSGRRRRRRRGGRGRGRGGRGSETTDGQPEEQPDDEDLVVQQPDDEDLVVEHPDEVPTLPQHSGFGSVWDSQIGVPADTALTSSATRPEEEEEFEDEPEVPEYLLAEKRQGRRSGGGAGRGRGRGGRSGGYRSAIDRERYGTGSSFSRSSGGGKGRSASTPRASVHAMEPIEQTRGGDPWSEVPPEVQALLKAELARREGAAEPRSKAPAEEEQPKKRTTRKRPTKKAALAEAEAPVEEAAGTPAEEEQPKKRTTRKRPTKKAALAEAEAPVEEAAGTPAEEEQPKKRTTRKRPTKKAALAEAEAPVEEAAGTPAEEEQPKKRTTRKRPTKKAAVAEAEAPVEEA